jgi:hypothetical protein
MKSTATQAKIDFAKEFAKGAVSFSCISGQ